MLPEVQVRPFPVNGNGRDSDYASLAALYRRVWPRFAVDAARLRAQDGQRRALGPALRRIVEVGGRPIGVGEVYRSPYFAEEGHFVVTAGLVPRWRSRHAMRSLADAIEEDAAALDPVRLVTYAAGHDTLGMSVARAKGYEPFQCETEYVLHVSGFDEAAHAARLAKPADHGIRIVSVRDLAHEPRRDWRIWELDAELFQQIPGEQGARPDFAPWRAQVINRPDFLADGSFVAVDTATGEYVGLTLLFAEPRRGVATIEITGVRASHRRMGLATALKVRSIAWAKQAGLSRVHTYNDTTNEPIRRLNESLGFVAGGEWWTLHQLEPQVATTAHAMASLAVA